MQRCATVSSDAPVKVVLEPLHTFITELGPAPPMEAILTYLQRMKEQGWHVWQTMQKVLGCGSHHIKDAAVGCVARLSVR
jgi:hypothetical protein